MKRLKKSFLGIFLTLVLVLGFQILSPRGVMAATPSSVSVDMAPTSPAPGQSTTIVLSSYANDLDSVQINWVKDGKTVASGIGIKSYTFTAPAAGASTTIVVTLGFPDGAVEKRFVIKPAVMGLLWQANDSYVPPFYKGKAMPMLGSEIKIVAMPEVKTSTGSIINATNMTYDWQKDYTNDASNSGYGKNYYIYNNDYLEDSNTVTVTATSLDGSTSSNASIDVGAYDAKILFYKVDDNLGTIWQQALADNHTVVGSETVLAIPYFLSPKNLRNPVLTWSWGLNGSSISIAGNRKNLIPLKVQSGTTGTSALHVDIANRSRIFESASGGINFKF